MTLLRVALITFLMASYGFASTQLGSNKAIKGGSFTIGLTDYPKHLQYYLATEEYASLLNSFVVESLLDTDLETNDPMGLLAQEWSISEDKKTFTFRLNPGARFSDGKSVTAEDVKFTWDTIRNPKNKTAPFQAYYAHFESCTVIDPLTVQFKATTIHFKNLKKLGGLLILPKHIYAKKDFNRGYNNELMGSGPYLLEEAKRGDKIILKRNSKYWGESLPQNKGRYNFDKIVLKAVRDSTVLFEMFKRGDIDYYFVTISKIWNTEMGGPLFEKKYILKNKVENRHPSGMAGIWWNLRKPLFQDPKVRLALTHLFNREKYIQELFYNAYIPTTGLIGLQSEYRSPKLKAVPYDAKKARELLKSAGWTKTSEDGVLINGNMRFEFELLNESPNSLRHLTVYQEDLKKMGIRMNIRTTDWASALKLLDDHQFDAVELGFTRETDPSDFASLWGSDQANIKGGHNITGYQNKRVDELAKQIDETFDKKKRIKLVQELDETVMKDFPITFAWEAPYYRLAYWNRFSHPDKVYFNYSSWKDVFHFWWYDKEKDSKLKAAMQKGEPLS